MKNFLKVLEETLRFTVVLLILTFGIAQLLILLMWQRPETSQF